MQISEEEINFIRLLMLSTDLSSDVTKAFVESKVLCNYDDDIVNLLESHKHDLFHAWAPNVNCCQCSSVAMGSIVSKKFSTINEAIFVKLYENHGSTNSGHLKRGLHGLVTQHCLCRFSARSDLRLQDLDLGLLSIIIFQCVQLNTKDHESIKTIRNMRWEIMNKGESRSYPTDAYTRTWGRLSCAVKGLAQDHFSGSHRRITEKQIELIKIAEVDKVNVDELMEKLNSEKVVAQYLKSSNKKGESKEMIHDGQRTDVNYIGRDEGIELELDKVCDAKSAMEFFTELLKKIRFDITHSALPKLVNGFLKSLGTRYCRFRLETPQTWDNQKMVVILNETDKVHHFQIIKAEVGSLVIKTTANPDIMKDRETFQNAVRSFLEKLVEVCEIDTSVPATIPVEINISGGPFADSELSNGHAASGGAEGGISNGEGEVQFQIRSQECNECKEKQETIDRLQRELQEKDAYIAELQKRLSEMQTSKKEDVDDVD